MEEKLRWFKFYPHDFLLSQKVQAMTDKQIGWYILLLCHQWIEGTIPNNFQLLAPICKTTPHELSSAQILLKCFPAHGRIRRNEKLHLLREESLERYQHLSEIGQKGGHASAKVKHTLAASAQAKVNPRSTNKIRLDKNRIDKTDDAGSEDVSHPSSKTNPPAKPEPKIPLASKTDFTPLATLVDNLLKKPTP